MCVMGLLRLPRCGQRQRRACGMRDTLVDDPNHPVRCLLVPRTPPNCPRARWGAHMMAARHTTQRLFADVSLLASVPGRISRRARPNPVGTPRQVRPDRTPSQHRERAPIDTAGPARGAPDRRRRADVSCMSDIGSAGATATSARHSVPVGGPGCGETSTHQSRSSPARREHCVRSRPCR